MPRLPSWLWLILFFFLVSFLALDGVRDGQPWAAFLQSDDFALIAYETSQLFVLEGTALPEDGQDVPWQLMLAAFLAPVVTILAFLQLIWRDIVASVSAFLHRYVYRNHVVVIGYGWRGQAFSRDALAKGYRVVAVDSRADALRTPADDRRRFRLLQGDARAMDLVKVTGAHRATAVVVFCGGTHAGVSVARAVSAALGRTRRPKDRLPRVICHARASVQRDQVIEDQSLTESPDAKIEFYSPEEAVARAFVRRFPPRTFAGYYRQDRPRVAVVGDGALAREIVQHVAVLSQVSDGSCPEITLFTADPTQFEDLAARLAPVCAMHMVRADLPRGDGWRAEFLERAKRLTQVVVCTDRAGLAADLALALRKDTETLLWRTPPVFLGPHEHGTEPDPTRTATARPFPSTLVTAFGDSASFLGWDHVVAQRQDTLARANHEAYLQKLRRETGHLDPVAKPAARPWSDLGVSFRASNRSFVDHITQKLALVGCVLAPDNGTAQHRFDDAEIDMMARAEHNRWRAERLAAGWTHGESRDDMRLRHPDLVDWEALPDATRAYDIALVRAIPEIVQAAGYRVAPLTRIGVSGHRDRRISAENRRLVAAIDVALKDIQSACPGHVFEVVSPLAEGADRLVARRAMALLDARLTAVLPFRMDLYRQDFVHTGGANAAERTRHSLAEFQHLLDEATTVFELPALAEDTDIDQLRTRQYEAAGAWLLQHCDRMVLVWDGNPARGQGGTGDVAGWAHDGDLPERLRWPGARHRLATPHIVAFER
ncbi:RyR domain-containing protein [Psychromarinibacter sp. C21-152]|uniref:RyR domain-containing protein n=1 Tax=Psychromarinibacter sediminicola TaxID=3033385 RepID=A0AAE3NSB6_9RHOB|nr:RyR domain-containing protein [Psychromarinibacter sediminicola]MDF0601111.1 RyR domain-containing protein [Psychromarinibacter sediminicola]